MSDKMTRIRLPGQKAWSGLMDWGELDAAEMIAQARHYATHLRAQADVIDAAADDQFQIDVVRGPHAQHHIQEVQKALSAPEQQERAG